MEKLADIDLSFLPRSVNMHIRIIHGKIGKLSWKTVTFWLRTNETYLHDQMTEKRLALLDKFLAGNTVISQLHSLAFGCLRLCKRPCQ